MKRPSNEGGPLRRDRDPKDLPSRFDPEYLAQQFLQKYSKFLLVAGIALAVLALIGFVVVRWSQSH